MRVVEMFTLWNAGTSAAAAALTVAICAAVGWRMAPKVGDAARESMYGALPIAGTRPLALRTLATLLVPLTPATVGTCHPTGNVRTLVPAPLYGV